MSNEIQVMSSLTVNAGTVQHRSPKTAYNDDMTGRKGPCVGTISVSTAGTEIPMTQITVPGYIELTNLDSANFVEYGIWDTETVRFFPLGELRPGGKPQVLFLSRNLLQQYEGTGTGTTAATNKFWLKANGASCNVTVSLFER